MQILIKFITLFILFSTYSLGVTINTPELDNMLKKIEETAKTIEKEKEKGTKSFVEQQHEELELLRSNDTFLKEKAKLGKYNNKNIDERIDRIKSQITKKENLSTFFVYYPNFEFNKTCISTTCKITAKVDKNFLDKNFSNNSDIENSFSKKLAIIEKTTPLERKVKLLEDFENSFMHDSKNNEINLNTNNESNTNNDLSKKFIYLKNHSNYLNYKVFITNDFIKFVESK